MRKPYVIGAALVVALAGTAAAVAAFNGNVGTHLQGRFEVPLRDTNAQGEAIFQMNDDGTSVDYR